MKAKFTWQQYEEFKKYLSVKENRKKVQDTYLNKDFSVEMIQKYGRDAHSLLCNSLRDITGYFDSIDKGYSGRNSNIENFETLVRYTEMKDLTWQVKNVENYALITFSGNTYFYLLDFATVLSEPDYENMTIAQMRAELSDYGGNAPSFLPAEMTGITISSRKEKLDEIAEKEKEIKDLRDAINYNREEKLAEMEQKLNEIRIKMDERKKELRAEMDARMEVLNKEKAKLEREIIVLESEIYTIRSYAGETTEVTKVRSGRKAPAETPLIINQKMQYLDEDLARMVSIYQTEIAAKYSMFEEALKYCNEVVETFCPQERCITFFRLSKNATYRYFNIEHNMYETEALLHGKKIGCLIKDGENLFLTWFDETWGEEEDKERGGQKARPVSFTDNVMFRPGESVSDIDDQDMLESASHSTSSNEMVSRVFCMSALQGILDSGMIAFPEKVNIMNPSRYIVYNFADAYLMDNRYGDFNCLTENLRKYTREKDTILIIFNGRGGGYRSNGKSDRTHDCEIEEGVYQLNLIKDGEVFVSLKKRYSSTWANFKVREDEYINLSYMNSLWLQYYITTKKLGQYANDYARIIKHLKRSLEVVLEREKEEIALIKEYYPDADKVTNWQEKLSYWKLFYKIRVITDFQAKRVAKYFEKGQFFKLKNLFTKEELPNTDFVSTDYPYTQLRISETRSTCSRSIRSELKEVLGERYCNEDFSIYISYWHKNDKDRMAEKMDEVKELFKKVPARVKKDELKLEMIQKVVKQFLSENSILAQELCEQDPLIFEMPYISKDENVAFVISSGLSKEQIAEIKAGKAVGIYYVEEWTTNGPLWELYYYHYLQCTYERMMNTAKRILHKRWLTATEEYANK